MKRLMTASLSLMLAGMAMNLNAQHTPVSQMEKLDRGVVAVPGLTTGNFVSWRMLGTDDEDRTTFELLRDGASLTKTLYTTYFKDGSGTKSSKYQVVTNVDGVPVDTSEVVTPWTTTYKTIQLSRPADGKTKPYTTTINKETVSYPNGQDYSYSPNDMSVGDVDGDGQYELFVKWDPSNSKDNSQNGVTGIVYIDCYKMDGTLLWRINLGQNIRAGAHYTQFMVYDFDGDGKAELMCKTAPGSKDGQGNYVNQAATENAIKNASNTKDWSSEGAGRIDGGQEYLTVFEGTTGRAIHTIAYYPNRNAKAELSEAAGSYNWGGSNKTDKGSYGNRGERYLAAVAYLDGPDKPACGIFSRGYYTYAHVWAVSFDGEKIHPKWLHSSTTTSSYSVTTWNEYGAASTSTYNNCKPTCGSGSGTMYGNGNHNLSVADVDGDGCDEIIWGSAGCDHNGKLLYGTGFGHGDAIHLADHCPDNPGLEVFQVHEEKGTYAWDLHEAATGKILLKGGPEGVDNGRGLAGQFDANIRGSLFWSASDKQAYSASTGRVASSGYGSMNFRIYWDGDLQEELLDGNKIDKWNGSGTSRIYINGKDLYNQGGPASTCNGTKNTPCLQADILGDWREEVILHNGADQIAIYTTNTETPYRIPTLMHDHTYRMGVCWQNTAYNQPPHLGYYLPDALLPKWINEEKELALNLKDSLDYTVKGRYLKSYPSVTKYILPDGTTSTVSPSTIKKTIDFRKKTVTLKGTFPESGDYRFVITLTGLTGEKVTDTLTVHVGNVSGIEERKTSANAGRMTVYDTAGRRLPYQSLSELPQGLYIIREGARSRKIMVR